MCLLYVVNFLKNIEKLCDYFQSKMTCKKKTEIKLIFILVL